MNIFRPVARTLLPSGLLLLALTGCLQTKDELTLESDGSGRVRLEVRSSLPAEMVGQLTQGMEAEGKSRAFYPPLSEEAAKRFFPETSFAVKITESKENETERRLIVEATFKDVNALLASPYAEAHALVLRTNGGRLQLQALSGLEAAALASGINDLGPTFGLGFSLSTLKANQKPLRSEFVVTLPGRASSTNGVLRDRTVTWVADGAVLTNHVELAQRLGTILEASCPGSSLEFTPLAPLRLNLGRFAELQAGASSGEGKAPKTQEVLAAARFVPHALSLTRTLDLSGDSSGGRTREAQLFASIVLPRALKPERWGEPVLDEVLDSRGNNLKLAVESRGSRSMYVSGQSERDDPSERPASEPEERRSIVLRFLPPEWRIPEVSSLKGSISLHYSGAVRELVKLTNAVPAGWIKTISKEEEMSFGDAQRPISDPALPALGLSLAVHMAMAQEGFTMLMVQVGGQKAQLADLCVFDVEGRPWPTFFNNGEESQCTIMVAGRPKPPLSLALVATKSGGEVRLPFHLEHIPLHSAGK